MTISSFLSVPGISAMVLNCIWFSSMNFVRTSTSSCTSTCRSTSRAMRPKCSDSISRDGIAVLGLDTRQFAAPLDAERAEVAAPEVDDDRRLLLGEELVRGAAQLVTTDELVPRVAGRPPGHLVLDDLGQRLFVVARQVRFGVRRDLADVAPEHDLPGDLALVLVEVVLGFRVDVHDGRLHDAVGAGSPGLRQRQQFRVIRGDHADRARLVLPSATERTPALEVGIREAPLGQLRLRPLVGFLQLRSAGQARPDPVHQLGGRFHHLGVSKLLLANPAGHLEVDAFFGREAREGQGQAGRGRRRSASGAGDTSLFGAAARYQRTFYRVKRGKLRDGYIALNGEDRGCRPTRSRRTVGRSRCSARYVARKIESSITAVRTALSHIDTVRQTKIRPEIQFFGTGVPLLPAKSRLRLEVRNMIGRLCSTPSN